MRSFPLIDLGITHTALLNGCLLHATHRSGLRPIRGNKFQRCTVPTQAHPASTPLSAAQCVRLEWPWEGRGKGKKKREYPFSSSDARRNTWSDTSGTKHYNMDMGNFTKLPLNDKHFSLKGISVRLQRCFSSFSTQDLLKSVKLNSI